ncbi:quinolinate synthase NadA [Peptostreptococcus faecalis]|uniref:quinolinate synthase NadA n=1 Tax=Peptostreptococcus faecalis TaxID=2045015 RepID=UPI000C7A819F|nr:quinolinate synthase NadA [Peptostreptococcus faecalis]
MNYIEEIKKLKKEKDVLILAHYYVSGEIQDVADRIGDSFQLAKDAQNAENDIICFCGVNFMGESAKVLNSSKKVIVLDDNAGCPMADMAKISDSDIDKLREEYDDLAVVSYVNTTADIKSKSDVCVTSSNAVKIVSSLPNKNIYFLPDKNLGSYIASKLPEKNFILHEGYCKYHNFVDYDEVKKLKTDTDYDVLVHPECPAEILSLADYIGSTKALLEYVGKTKKDGYIVCTESGIIHQMKKYSSESEFITPKSMKQCKDMKLNTLEKLYYALLNEGPEVNMREDLASRALVPLKRMMELG